MTREEQISQANPYDNGNPYWDEDNDIIGTRDLAAHHAFEEGVIWADEHPNWHKYPNQKPNKTDEYIVAFDNGNVYTAHYIHHRDKWHDNDIANNCNTSNVIAWMEFPKQPKFD